MKLAVILGISLTITAMGEPSQSLIDIGENKANLGRQTSKALCGEALTYIVPLSKYSQPPGLNF